MKGWSWRNKHACAVAGAFAAAAIRGRDVGSGCRGAGGLAGTGGTCAPALRNQLAVQRDALIALAGQYPDLDLETKFDLSHFTLPRDLPLVLPSKLVVQGPDIRQSESNLHAAGANIGQAARLMDTVALFQALGGGWWNRTP